MIEGGVLGRCVTVLRTLLCSELLIIQSWQVFKKLLPLLLVVSSIAWLSRSFELKGILWTRGSFGI